MLAGDLLHLRDVEFVAVFIENEDFLAPCLIDLAGEDLADLLRILTVDVGLLDVHDAALEVLADVEDTAATEALEAEFLGVLITNLIVVVTAVGDNLIEGHFGVGILNLFYDLEVLINFAGTFVDIDNDVEVVCGTVGLRDLGEEHVLEHAHHNRAVDAFLFLEVLEGINESHYFFFFHCISLFFYCFQKFVRLFGAETH